jgi:phage/plasmid-like protein (TIGR03299 family)
MVTPMYKLVQPRETLEFFRDLIDAAGFKLNTAGTLHGGRKFWALANINAEDRIVGNDLVKGRLMIATSCDGSMNTIVKNVAERVVCANTLAIALGESGAGMVRVSHRTHFDAVAVKKQLGIAVTSFERFVTEARKLAARRVGAAETQLFIAKVLGKADEDPVKVTEDKAFQSILNLFNGAGRGAQLPGVKGTAWGLVNAVTEHVDHYARARTLDNRMDSAWFHRGSDLKQTAMEEALVLVS